MDILCLNLNECDSANKLWRWTIHLDSKITSQFNSERQINESCLKDLNILTQK